LVRDFFKQRRFQLPCYCWVLRPIFKLTLIPAEFYLVHFLMSEFLIGEALLGKDNELAHIDLMMGDKSGPVGQAFATALVSMSKGHTPLLAVVRPNLMPKPAMVIVPKVTIQNLDDASKIFGPAQSACAKAVADCVEEGIIPEDKLDDWVIVACVFIHPDAKDERKIYKYNYSATRLAIKRALDKYPSLKKLMEEKDRAKHPVSSVKGSSFRLWRPPYLQIALDNPSLSSALSIIKQSPHSDRIIWEAGTPLVKKYGIDVVKELRKEAKDTFIVADLKTLDVGKVEVDMTFDADADAAVASGLSAIDSLDKFLMEADRMGIYGFVDMMNVPDPIAVLKKLKRAPRVVIIHRGIDMEGSQKMSQWEVMKEIKAMYKEMKPPILCAVAGGITPEKVAEATKNGADIIIVGRYITQSQDVERSIRNFINLMPGDSDIDLKRIHSDDDDKSESMS
jgi:bifunctional enzyme Fae/Hps